MRPAGRCDNFDGTPETSDNLVRLGHSPGASGFPLPSHFRRLRDNFVDPCAEIDADVGIGRNGARVHEENTPKQAEKRKNHTGTRWYVGCYTTVRRQTPMSPSPTLINRVRSEFIEMPGLRLRLEQAQRLWNLDRASCEVLLASLVEAKFLSRGHDEAYGRS